MTLARDTSQTARRIQLDALRRVDGTVRMEMALRMSDDARAISEAGVRHRHADWTEEAIRRSMLQLMIGPRLAARVNATKSEAG